MRYSRERMVKIINVCAALHNVCVENNISLDESPTDDNVQTQAHTEAEPIIIQNNLNVIASNIRDELKQLFL